MQVGDLVRINRISSAGGLWGLFGIVVGLRSLMNVDCARVRILSSELNKVTLVDIKALDVLSKNI
jgi:hypothetical protein